MPVDQIARTVVFAILTVMTLGGGLGVVSSRNIFHSALFLVLSFAGVVGYYILLDAGFLAVVQLLIYIGAIAILILFAIMVSTQSAVVDCSPGCPSDLCGTYCCLVAGGLADCRGAIVSRA